MLRRKLLLILGSVVALLVLMGVTAVWMLQGVLGDLNHIRQQALGTVDHVNQLQTNIALVQTELYRLEMGAERHLDRLIDAVENMRSHLKDISASYMVREPDCLPILERLQENLPQFEKHVGALATTEDPMLSRRHNHAALSTAVLLNEDILAMHQHVRQHVEEEQETLTTHFRYVVLGVAVAFLLLINVTIIVLLRTVEMILKPVDKLVRASRELAQERFGHRVQLERGDEFDELARAYNSLAEQLQANEQRRLEAIGQVALTLNHELNNAIAIIELQLGLMGRHSVGDASQEKYLRQIRQSLQRMTSTVEALKRVRRIVLTDYVAGVKMLDLERSVEEEPRQVMVAGGQRSNS